MTSLHSPGIVTINTAYLHYHIQTHQMKCNGIPQMLMMKRDVSAGEHAYNHERIIVCVITL